MVRQVETLIVGGGPAGLALARALWLRGQPSVVLDRRHWPIDKVCGEGLMPVGLAALERLGVHLEQGFPFAGIDYRWRGHRAGADFAEGCGRVLRRTGLSQALIHPQLEYCGGTQVLGLQRIASGFEVQTQRGTWRCRMLVGADGLHSRVRHLLGWNRPTPSWLRRWGWRQHFATPSWNSRVEVHLATHAEAYVSPAGESVGVAVLRGPGGSKKSWLQEFPQLRERLGDPLEPVAAIGPLWQRSQRVWAPGVVLLGDAAGYLDACTGEGLSLAFLQAEELARHWPHLQDWERRRQAVVHNYFWCTMMALGLMRLPRLFLPVLQQNPGLLQQLLSASQGLRSLGPVLLQLTGRALPAWWRGLAAPEIAEPIPQRSPEFR